MHQTPRFVPQSGSKPANIKIPVSPCQPTVRYPVSPEKGTQNPPHVHVNIPNHKPGQIMDIFSVIAFVVILLCVLIFHL